MDNKTKHSAACVDTVSLQVMPTPSTPSLKPPGPPFISVRCKMCILCVRVHLSFWTRLSVRRRSTPLQCVRPFFFYSDTVQGKSRQNGTMGCVPVDRLTLHWRGGGVTRWAHTLKLLACNLPFFLSPSAPPPQPLPMYAVTPKTVEVTVSMDYFVDDDAVVYLKRFEEALSRKQLCSIKSATVDIPKHFSFCGMKGTTLDKRPGQMGGKGPSPPAAAARASERRVHHR